MERNYENYTVKKSISERYDIRFPDAYSGWAIIILDEEKGLFSAQSDFGNYSYLWPNHGRGSFKEFVINDLARDTSYFLNKVSSKTYVDEEKTRKEWLRQVIELRREDECTQGQAREMWEFIRTMYMYSNNPEATLANLLDNCPYIWDIIPEPYFDFEPVSDYPPQARNFAEIVMPALAEILNQEYRRVNQNAR